MTIDKCNNMGDCQNNQLERNQSKRSVYICMISFISNSEKWRKQISSCLGLEVDGQD